MLCKTTDLSNGFVAVALRHDLVSEAQAVRIAERAELDDVEQCEAAVNLAALSPQQVEAVRLLEQPSSLAPGYLLTNLIGYGATGVVFRAKQIALDRDVALKTILMRRDCRAGRSNRIQREASLIARLNHPNIVAAYDSGFHRGRFWIAMELIEGCDLKTFIEQSGPISETTTWQITRQVALALAHANGTGTIHRDIKPANIIVDEATTGTDLPPGIPLVKVADFGLAFQLGDDQETNLTATGATLGTPAYVAPEQLLESHVDCRADIYSLGATVFHMLAGLAPSFDSSPMKVIIGKTVGDEAWRTELPDGLTNGTVNLFHDMTAANPGNRIQNYQQLIDRIDVILCECTSNQPRRKREKGKQKTASPIFQNTIKRKILKISLAVSIAVLVLQLGTLLYFAAHRPSAASVPLESGSWSAAGLPEPLFNGQSVPLFPYVGGWSPQPSRDGGYVLVGTNNAQMTIPLKWEDSSPDNFRFRISVHPVADAVAEVVLPEQEILQGKQRMVRLVLANGFASLVSKDRVGEGGKPVNGSKTIKLRSDGDHDAVFHQCTIARQGDTMRVHVNGTLLGSVHNVTSNSNGHSLTIRAGSGTVQFADIDIVPLVENSSSLQAPGLASVPD